MEAKKQRLFSIESKVRIIELLQSGKATKSMLSRLYGAAPSSISKIWKNREAILQTGKQFEGNAFKRYQINSSKFRMTEEALFMWIVQESSKNIVISNQDLRCQALNLHEMLKKSCGDVFGPFQASGGWLLRFKNRHGLLTTGENSSTENELKEFKVCKIFDQRHLCVQISYRKNTIASSKRKVLKTINSTTLTSLQFSIKCFRNTKMNWIME